MSDEALRVLCVLRGSYLVLDGNSKTAAGLTMTFRNKVQTDGSSGGGTLTLRSLTIDGAKNADARLR